MTATQSSVTPRDGWANVRIKFLLESCRNGIWGDEPDGGDDDVACARVADFDRVGLVVRGPLPTLRKVQQDQRLPRLLRTGDLLLEKSGGGEQTQVGAVVRWIGSEPAVCSNFVAVIRPRSKIDSRWLCYLFAHLYEAGINRRSIKQTTGIQNLDSDQYLNERVPVPPHVEQRHIADFLDRETARIDALIEKKSRFIELLREKRQAAITHAMTSGLDPNAAKVDSGYPFIGEVPQGWSIKRLKYVSGGLTVGIVVNPSEYVSTEGLPYVYGGDISEGKLDLDRCRRITEEHSDAHPKTRLSAGDLLTVRVGAPGVTAVVPSEAEGGNCASVMLIRKGGFDSDWLCYAMNSRVVRYQVELVQYGAAQEQFNISHAADFLLPVPPIHEQRELAATLNARSARLNGLIRKSERSVELLGERRAALITAAVTGQLDVRTSIPAEETEPA